MGRTYSVVFEKIAVSAVQDLVQIKGAAGKMLRIKRVAVSCVDATLPTAGMLAIRCRFLPVTVTDGNGTAVTPRAFSPGDAAASFTAIRNSTTPATTNGTAQILEENGTHVYAPYDYSFPAPPEIGPSESFVFELITAPVASSTLSGTVIVEELGG